jgi:5-methylcytosine-specific restriction endonuclease McrA
MHADRRSFTVKQRLAIYSRQNGLCAICGQLMPHGQYEIDHRVALTLGGTNDDDNLEAVHPKCHRAKTDADVAANSKADRIITGGTKRTSRPMPFGRYSRFKRKMSGQVVER